MPVVADRPIHQLGTLVIWPTFKAHTATNRHTERPPLLVPPGVAENTGLKNAIRAKLQGWKMQEWKKQQ